MKPLSPFHYQQGHLCCENTRLAEIADEVKTPVYIYSQAELLRRAKAYTTAVSNHPHLICYAVKANGNPTLLRLLVETGLGADVTSGGELFLAVHAGFPPEKIIFSGVGKTETEIETAVSIGIRALHVESMQEFALIASIASRMKQVVSIGVRVNPDISADTHPHIATGQQAHKFGVPISKALALLREAANHPWLRPVGLAAHIGSQIVDLHPFIAVANLLVQIAQKLASTGITLDYLDIGGGLGIDYTDTGWGIDIKSTQSPIANYQSPPSITEFTMAVTAPIIAASFEVIMEPGRSIVGPTGALLTRVLYTKKQNEKTFIITDAGMNDLFRPALYDAYHPIVPVMQYSVDSKQLTVDVVGPVCESGDRLARERPLPPLQPGDLLAILGAGAYGFAMSNNYNGRLKGAELLVHGREFVTIRQRQQLRHLLDGCSDYLEGWRLET